MKGTLLLIGVIVAVKGGSLRLGAVRLRPAPQPKVVVQ